MNKKSLNKTKIIDKFDFIHVGSNWFLTRNDEIYLTKNGNKVRVPNENFLELLRQEFRCLKIKNNTNPSLIEILINYADKSIYGKTAYVDELIKYLEINRKIFDSAISNIPGLDTMKLEGTYLAWVDFSRTGMEQKEFVNRVQDQAKIAANLGPTFGKNGHNFLRFNFATTTENVRIAAERLSAAFSNL